jgi:hypothetical protein
MYDEHRNQPKFVKVMERLEKGNLFSCLMMCRSIESTWRSMTGGSDQDEDLGLNDRETG